MEKSEIVNHFQKEGYPRRTIYNTINRFQNEESFEDNKKTGRWQTCAESHFFKEKVKVMTLTFLKGPLENTFRRFLSAPIGYLINTLHL
jgi:hypothetical protein